MADVGTAATFANGEVVGGACSNAGSDTTESKNIAPSGGRGASTTGSGGSTGFDGGGSNGFSGGGGSARSANGGDVSPMRWWLEFN
jgi:hypothetical protein